MKIGVIGLGTVGSAIHESFTTLGHVTSFFDTKDDTTSIKDVIDTDVIFICVPTKQNDTDGSCDTSIVESTVDHLSNFDYNGLVIIKSTTVPGTADKLIQSYKNLRMVYSPEFLRASTALSDFLYNQDIIVVGTYAQEDYDLVKKLHGKICSNIQKVSPTEAEIIKYFNNVHHAVNIVFANMMYDVCKKVNCNYENVYDVIGQRDCINTSYLNCNENLREYGGECLPKDISAWNNLIKNLGLKYKFIDSVMKDNRMIANEGFSNWS